MLACLRASPATYGRRKVASEDESFRKNGTQMSAARGRPSWSKPQALPRVRGSAPPPGVSPGSSLPPGNSHRPASCLPSRPLRDEHAPVGIDQRTGDDEQDADSRSCASRDTDRHSHTDGGSRGSRKAPAPAALSAATLSAARSAPCALRPGKPGAHHRARHSPCRRCAASVMTLPVMTMPSATAIRATTRPPRPRPNGARPRPWARATARDQRNKLLQLRLRSSPSIVRWAVEERRIVERVEALAATIGRHASGISIAKGMTAVDHCPAWRIERERELRSGERGHAEDRRAMPRAAIPVGGRRRCARRRSSSSPGSKHCTELARWVYPLAARRTHEPSHSTLDAGPGLQAGPLERKRRPAAPCQLR